jgi:hypothetical protein
MKRECGQCQLCCELVPVEEILKKAGHKCEHQKEGVGCSIYERRPMSCAFYFCGWLGMDAAKGLTRPDQSHYVIHPEPDYIKMTAGDDAMDIKVMVIWCDPKFSNAHRDPKLRYILNKNKVIAKVCFDSIRSIVVIPPSLNPEKVWQERQVTIDWTTPLAKWALENGMV